MKVAFAGFEHRVVPARVAPHACTEYVHDVPAVTVSVTDCESGLRGASVDVPHCWAVSFVEATT